MDNHKLPPQALARLTDLVNGLAEGDNVTMLVTFMTKDGNVGFNSFGPSTGPNTLGMLDISKQIVLDSMMPKTPAEQPRILSPHAMMPNSRQ